MESIWKNYDITERPSLDGDISTDVLIIGGGATGILTSYFLKNAGIDSVIAEKNRILSGVTANTTAKITAQHGFIYSKIAEKYGLEAAKKYLSANLDALCEYEKMSHSFQCDFEKKDNCIFSVSDRYKAEKEMATLEKIGYNAVYSDDVPLPLKISGAVSFPSQAQFHPMKFFGSVAENLTIYENTHVLEMVGTTAVTGNGKIHAKAVVVATHFPMINKHGSYFLKMYQHRSYVLALKNAGNVNGMYADENDSGLSFRSYGDLLLLGGAGGKTGKGCGGWDELNTFAKEHYSQSETVSRWATQDCMTLDGMPYIGRYSKGTENLYVATGFNKWGMTGTMTAAKILSDMISGRENEYADVFSPSRSILHTQLLINGFTAAANLLTPAKKRCPHLGCALKWNKAERTWDCPCHGSRFTEAGKLLDNPANGDMKGGIR